MNVSRFWVLLPLALLVSCVSRHRLVTDSCAVSSATTVTATTDTIVSRQLTQEREQVAWVIDVVRTYSDSSCSESPSATEKWRIRAVSTRDLQRADSLTSVRQSVLSTRDSVATTQHTTEVVGERGGRIPAWVASLMLVVLSIISVGLIVKR